MKRLWFSLVLIGLLSAACGSPGATIATQPAPTETPAPPTPTPDDLTPAQRAALQTLADILKVPVDQIKFISTEAVEWPDACLGLAQGNIVCAQVVTPGFRIILEADGKRYEYHTDTDGSTVIPVPGDSASVETIVVNALAAMLGLRPNEIIVVNNTPMEWPDACLGMEQLDMACAEVITPGFLVVLEANGVQYEYHTNQDGSVVLSATALAWHREGGIAGFCDDLTISRLGEFQASYCRPNRATANGDLAKILSEAELAEFSKWLNEFGTVTIKVEDPAVADQMKVTLTLNGMGRRQPTEAEQQRLMNWAQTIYDRVKP